CPGGIIAPDCFIPKFKTRAQQRRWINYHSQGYFVSHSASAPHAAPPPPPAPPRVSVAALKLLRLNPDDPPKSGASKQKDCSGSNLLEYAVNECGVARSNKSASSGQCPNQDCPNRPTGDSEPFLPPPFVVAFIWGDFFTVTAWSHFECLKAKDHACHWVFTPIECAELAGGACAFVNSFAQD